MIVVGIAIRFIGLDGKIFGNDEATTSLHVSGKTIVQYAATMFDGHERSAQDLLVFQKPDRLHGVRDVIASLAVEDPQHPPLYYLLERQWEVVGGSSIAARRVLAAVFGAISVLTAIWLGLELASLLAGLVTGALVAASPFAIAYSQVAREYSLWMALTFAASALLVRAMRSGSVVVWLAYVVVSILGLYSDALYLLVFVAHALAVTFVCWRRRPVQIAFAACSILIICAYLPWVSALFYGYTHGVVTNNAYLAAALSLKTFALKWLFNVGSLFYDADYAFPKSAILIIPGLIALAAAFLYCLRQVRGNSQLLLIPILAVVTLVALLYPDIAHHQQRSTASRYLVPLWVACYAALGIFLAGAVRSSRPGTRMASVALVFFCALTGFGSLVVSAKHETWWIDGSTAGIGPIARAIDAVRNPVVVYHATWGPGSHGPDAWDFNVVMVANMVPATTPFVQYGRDDFQKLPALEGSLLLVDPNDATLSALRVRGDEVTKIAGGHDLPGNADVGALRQSVAHERQRQGAGAALDRSPELWAVHRLMKSR